jgi:hypothetical protein
MALISKIYTFDRHIARRVLLAAIVTLAWVGMTPRGSVAGEVAFPAAVNTGINHLLSLVGPRSTGAFDPGMLDGLMAFAAGPKPGKARYVSGAASDLPSAYLDVDIGMPFEEFVRYSFHPLIPWFTTTPSSLRLTRWKHAEAKASGLSRLWELPKTLSDPLVVRGVETVENTPDLSTGAYYRYDLYRTLILWPRAQGRVLISLSRQAGPSGVGKKGYIVGSDEDWNYIYSGEPGLSISGLGWAKSHMYESAGISVYLETGGQPGQVRVANFKWLRAGWSGINMVENHHIHEGMERFARTLKTIMESPRLPTIRVLEASCRRIASLSDADIREKIQVYGAMLADRAAQLKTPVPRTLLETMRAEGYWEQWSRVEMESALVLEAFKSYLGRSADAGALRLSSIPAREAPGE